MTQERSVTRMLVSALYSHGGSLGNAPSYLNGEGPRACAHRIAFAYLDWALPESPSRGSDADINRLDALTRRLLGFQAGDGTVDSDNFHSPPDTAFVCDTLEAALRIASRETGPRGAVPAREALDRITLFCDRAADMLVGAGVHTPNHRWVVCAVLAQAYRRTGKAEYRDRCLDWLDEGVDIDSDGQFSERSSGIYTPVTCQSLIRVADGLRMPELLGCVRRSLEATLHLIQPGGEVETVASRRQDQAQTAHLSRQVFPFAYMAALDGDPRFAWAALQGLERPGEAMECLPAFLAYPPKGDDCVLPQESEGVTEYTAFLAEAGLARRRSGELAISVYGGSDLALDPSLPDASGIASNPALLTFMYGPAACRWLRLRPRYFDLPAARFRLDGFDGETARLSWKRTVPYFGPLPRDKRRPGGDYGLSTGDRRFWSKMDFGERPWVNECSLEARVAVRLRPTLCALEVEAGANVVTDAMLELAFDAESHVAPLAGGGQTGLEISLGGRSFRVVSEGEGAWGDVSGKPTGESGRHACLRDGEGAPKALKRWAYEFRAPCRFTLTLEAISP
jgi:hypothetical protein